MAKRACPPSPAPPRRAWTRAEDRRLLYAIARVGMSWQAIEAELPERNARAIRKRYARLLAGRMAGGDAAAEDAMLTIANYV